MYFQFLERCVPKHCCKPNQSMFNTLPQETFSPQASAETRFWWALLDAERAGKKGPCPQMFQAQPGRRLTQMANTVQFSGCCETLRKPKRAGVASQRAQLGLWGWVGAVVYSLKWAPGGQCMSAPKTVNSKCRPCVGQTEQQRGPRSVWGPLVFNLLLSGSPVTDLLHVKWDLATFCNRILGKFTILSLLSTVYALHFPSQCAYTLDFLMPGSICVRIMDLF